MVCNIHDVAFVSPWLSSPKIRKKLILIILKKLFHSIYVGSCSTYQIGKDISEFLQVALGKSINSIIEAYIKPILQVFENVSACNLQ